MGKKIFSIAFDKSTFEILMNKGLNVALINENGLLFWPENVSFELSIDNKEKLNTCSNYDVLYINENGTGFHHFANENDDNPLILTQKCNSNCIMCPTTDYVRQKENEIWIETIIDSINYIPDDARHLTITGGEPFLVKDKIFDLLNEIKIKLPYTDCLLLTNGRALGYKPYADEFARTTPNKMTVGIPLHGYNAETHDYITQSPGGFVQTVAGIKNLLYRGVKVELRIVVSKLNYKIIQNISDLIVSEFPKADSVKIMGLEMFGNAAKNVNDVWIPYRTAFEYSKTSIFNLVNHQIPVTLYNFPLCAVDSDCHLLCAKSITGYKIRYDEKCETCKKKQNCGGIFAGTIRLAGKDVIPWR